MKALLDYQLRHAEASMQQMQMLWEIPASELEFQDVIAAGACGKVARALWNDLPVAVKLLKGAVMLLEETAVADFQRECAFMKSIRHPNIILFFGAGHLDDEQRTPFLVLELSERGSLHHVLTATEAIIEWSQKLTFARDTAAGMQHLHSLGCIHRDLKSGNLLVTQNNHIKVSDFGTSTLAARLQSSEAPKSFLTSTSEDRRRSKQETDFDFAKKRTMTRALGTPPWMAPEILISGRKVYDNKIDVYAYGVVLFEILAQSLPWTELEESVFMKSLRALVLTGKRPTLPAGVTCPDNQYLHLMQRCWAQLAADRPTFAEICAHPLLQAGERTSQLTAPESQDDLKEGSADQG
jgi:serine/threonine protein kinase